ncbi:MAG: GTP 3',8-cyclase MoaA [Planctomycetes bacterium]|nr:GTP 3',8-cyclase MoaA [Planctomycetota bacterium]MCB9911248.1 GTP 3',8-cyclase MoaA [Planctomycetota bacterium]HPF15715.1 GTP 3',8-cyclase MoaA [Planctomycetota bacterium]
MAHELPPGIQDVFGRVLANLRISVTDRCNLRCHYCMPEREYEWLPKADRLTFEELERLVARMAPLGVRNLRITGGEPLLRRELAQLIARLARIPGIEDIALTTNGILLADQAEALWQAGLSRLTISLDTLRPDRFRKLTGQDRLSATLAGLEAAQSAGFAPIKLNMVVCRGSNDDEVESLLEFALEAGHELRFIEYMDVGGALDWRQEQVLSKGEILERIAHRFGTPEPAPTPPSAPAQRFQLPGGGRFGVIASTTAPFCGTCTRARLTADGWLYACLYATQGLDLRKHLRDGATDEQLTELLTAGWTSRRDRGAEERLAQPAREASVDREELRRDPHLEMHTKGG